MSRFAAALCLILAMSFTGANVPAGKVVVTEIPVLVFLVFRFAVSGVTLAALAIGEPGPRLTAMSARDWRDVAIMAVVGSVLFMFFMLEGTRRTAAIDAGIITATIPAAVAVLGILVHRKLPKLDQVAAVGLAVAGLAVMQSASASAEGAAGNASSLTGNLLVGIAVVCEAIFVIISQRMSGRLRPIRLSLAVALASLACVLPLAIPSLLALDWQAISATTWLLAVWYTLSSSVFCTILWYMGAPHVEPWVAGLATAAMPITAVIVATMALGEPLGPARIAGALLVIAAITAGALSQR